MEFILQTKNKAFSFRTYSDIDGNTCGVEVSKDKNQNPVYKQFVFEDGSYSTNNTRDIEFIQNHPECYGSPNYRGIISFKELDVKKDAVTSTELAKMRIKAESIAIGLEGEELATIAVLCGTNNPDPTFQLEKVLQFASKNPKSFLEMTDGKTEAQNEATAVLKKSIALGTSTLKGTVIYFDDIRLGINEDKAVEMLLSEPDILLTVKNANNKAEQNIENREDKRVINTYNDDHLAKHDFDMLRKEAKELKIAGWQFVKDMDILKKKIEAKKATV